VIVISVKYLISKDLVNFRVCTAGGEDFFPENRGTLNILIYAPFDNRFGRHELHYLIFFGSMYLWAAVSQDVVLGWSLTVARFLAGSLHLLAVFGDRSMSNAFLAFAIPDITTALLAAMWLPSYKKAFPKRCRSPDLKSVHIFLAFISIMMAALHMSGNIQINQIYSLPARQISFGAFPVVPNSE
jgi:hypothetical protein